MLLSSLWRALGLRKSLPLPPVRLPDRRQIELTPSSHQPQAPKKDLPEEIVVFGISAYTLALLATCRESGIAVRGVVDHGPERLPGVTLRGFDPNPVRAGVACQGIDLIPLESFLADVRSGRPGQPIVAAMIESQYRQPAEADPFVWALRTVREVGGRLWHPAALASGLPLKGFRQRAALIAYPGSGNVLALSMLTDLVGRLDAPRPSIVEWGANFTEHLFVSTSNLFRNRLAHLPIAEFGFNTAELPTLAVSVRLNDGRMAVVRNVPSNRHHAQFVYHSHSTPSQWAMDEFERLGVPCVVVVRHPFETVLALASKFRRPPGPVLDDSAWLAHEAREMAEWYRRLREQRSRLLVVRYEDLIARRAEPVRAMAERAGVPLDEPGIERLYDKYLFRNLSDRQQGHFNTGGSDKWRKHFARRHREPFIKAGLQWVFDEWGYDGLHGSGPDPVADDGPAIDFPMQTMGAVSMAFWRQPDYELPTGAIPYELRSSSPEAAAALREVLSSKELSDLLSAGGIGAE
ncbi:MAG TPA: hypothetical protein VGI99_00805, partial [Gemmataceae bacterium]